jgi:hypothetical protein
MGVLMALSLILAAVAAGCGGETTDVSGGVTDLNKQLTDQGLAAELDCPKEIDGGEGTEFECTLKGTDSGTEEKVDLKVQKEGDKLVVNVADQAKFDASLQKVAGEEAAPAEEEAAPEEEVAPEEEAAPEEETP